MLDEEPMKWRVSVTMVYLLRESMLEWSDTFRQRLRKGNLDCFLACGVIGVAKWKSSDAVGMVWQHCPHIDMK